MEDMDMDAGPSTSKEQKGDEEEEDHYGGVSVPYVIYRALYINLTFTLQVYYC